MKRMRHVSADSSDSCEQEVSIVTQRNLQDSQSQSFHPGGLGPSWTGNSIDGGALVKRTELRPLPYVKLFRISSS